MIRNALLTLCFLLTGVATAAPKVAVVKVGEVYQELGATKKMTAEIKEQRDAIFKDPRLVAYKAALQELEVLQKSLIKAADQGEATRTRTKREFSLKRQEALVLKREFDSFRQTRTKEIDKEMVERMETILAEIHGKVNEVGEKMGYDWVMDVSGKSNTGLPFILYSKKSDDITSHVISAIQRTIAETTQDDSN